MHENSKPLFSSKFYFFEKVDFPEKFMTIFEFQKKKYSKNFVHFLQNEESSTFPFWKIKTENFNQK